MSFRGDNRNSICVCFSGPAQPLPIFIQPKRHSSFLLHLPSFELDSQTSSQPHVLQHQIQLYHMEPAFIFLFRS